MRCEEAVNDRQLSYGASVFTVVGSNKAPAPKVCDVVMRSDLLYLSPAKAKPKLGWEPEITAQEMCAEMVVEDLKAAKRLKLLKAHGLDVPVSLEG